MDFITLPQLAAMTDAWHDRMAKGVHVKFVECPDCKGTGEDGEGECVRCEGSGEVVKDE